MNDVRLQEPVLAAPDGHEIHVRIFEPAAGSSGVIQVLHGLGEHIGRYERFARAAAARGFATCLHNHRGHGERAIELGFLANDDGWRLLVDDAKLVHDDLRSRTAGQPVVLLGHSMGSFVAQTFAMHYGATLAGLLVSASNWPQRAQLVPAMLLARMESFRLGAHGRSALLHRLGFSNFNRRFEPARTELDWLSRDEAEVDAYIADPLCDGPYTCGLWTDLLGGLFDLGSDNALNRIASDLPILISGGSDDPIGGERGMTRLAMHYAQTGHTRMSLKIYKGGRHEMLNETNRDEVTADWLDWIAARMRAGTAPAR